MTRLLMGLTATLVTVVSISCASPPERAEAITDKIAIQNQVPSPVAITPNYDLCGDIPYAVGPKGFTASLGADVVAQAIPEISNTVNDLDFDFASTDLTGEVRLEISRKTTRLLGFSAYQSVSRVYFCRLRIAIPSLGEELDRAEFEFVNMLRQAFDAELLSMSYADRQQQFEEIADKIQLEPSVLSSSVIPFSVIPDSNFVERIEIGLKAAIDVSKLATVYGCLGANFSSIAVIDERVFGGLQALRADLILFLRGSYNAKTAFANVFAVSSGIFQQPTSMSELTEDDIACAQQIGPALRNNETLGDTRVEQT